MPSKVLLKYTERYRMDQVDSPAKVGLLWRNVLDVVGLEQLPSSGVLVDVQRELFDDDAVTVTFGAYVRRK